MNTFIIEYQKMPRQHHILKCHTVNIECQQSARHFVDRHFVTNAGTSTITIAGGSATNYSFNTSDTAILTINKATMTGSVSVTGTATKGELLTAVPDLTNTETPTYKWFRGITAISGATGTTYTLVSADVGSTITVTATAGGANYQGTITSSPTASVKDIGPTITTYIAGYFPSSPASPTILNFTGFTANLAGVEARVALNGSTYGSYADIEVDSRGRAMILLSPSTATTATRVQFRIKETATTTAGPVKEISIFAKALTVGDYYQGGVVAYIYASTDAGYISGQVRGLIAAKDDTSSSIKWSDDITTSIGTEIGIGTGLENTNRIVSALGASASSYAAVWLAHILEVDIPTGSSLHGMSCKNCETTIFLLEIL